jgi:hypothetical protein
VAALIRGDGAADLGQHLITMLQGVAGSVAVGDLNTQGQGHREGSQAGFSMHVDTRGRQERPRPRTCSRAWRAVLP